jgi:glycosyltransferase involved in cell wall biosynthesis
MGGFLMQNRITLYLFKIIECFVLTHADFVCVIGGAAAQELTEVFGRDFKSKIRIIPYPVPDEFYVFAEPSRLTNAIRLIYDGNITGLYDFSGLVKALEELHASGKAISLVVYSSERGRRILKSLTSIETLLVFKDQLPRTDLAKIIREATAVVVPLVPESPGISIKAIEAMALCVPVIISYPKDPKIFRDGETCIIVPNNTAQEWRDAIIRITTPKLRDRILRGAREEAEAFRSKRNLEAISAILRTPPEIRQP